MNLVTLRVRLFHIDYEFFVADRALVFLRLATETLPPLMVESADLHLKFELEDISDLHENCVIEIFTKRETPGRTLLLDFFVASCSLRSLFFHLNSCYQCPAGPKQLGINAS